MLFPYFRCLLWLFGRNQTCSCRDRSLLKPVREFLAVNMLIPWKPVATWASPYAMPAGVTVKLHSTGKLCVLYLIHVSTLHVRIFSHHVWPSAASMLQACRSWGRTPCHMASVAAGNGPETSPCSHHHADPRRKSKFERFSTGFQPFDSELRAVLVAFAIVPASLPVAPLPNCATVPKCHASLTEIDGWMVPSSNKGDLHDKREPVAHATATNSLSTYVVQDCVMKYIIDHCWHSSFASRARGISTVLGNRCGKENCPPWISV